MYWFKNGLLGLFLLLGLLVFLGVMAPDRFRRLSWALAVLLTFGFCWRIGWWLWLS